VILLVFTCIVYADRNVPAMPEIQGLSTSTGMNVQGTITETDSGAWSVNDNGIPISPTDPSLANFPWSQYGHSWQDWQDTMAEDQALFPALKDAHLLDWINWLIKNDPDTNEVTMFKALLTWTQNHGSSLNPPLNDQEVQYTTGYNDQVMAVSGQSTFTKSIAVSTSNKIADQSNIKADTNLQYIAIDTGRATRTEDLLLDGAAQSIDTSEQILCPFAGSDSSGMPPYCNIEQSGSSLDSTLTSVVTHADDRFVGPDSTLPVVLNYRINAQGITLSDGTSSPMIGSVSAYLKVHIQEARNVTTSVILLPSDPEFPISLNPQKSEDLVYSETSSASGLISHFSKSMSYQSGFNLI
jgi:hypothetical protein